MDPLSFLYIALGVAALLVAIFVCATLIYVIQILRDVAKISDSVSETAERVNDYLVQPFAFLSSATDYIKPLLDTVMSKRDELNSMVNDKVHKVAKKIRRKMRDAGDE
ncbi:MAG: hypothetical protein U0519_04580 [Candidatus Gracilibacteria bacterium]